MSTLYWIKLCEGGDTLQKELLEKVINTLCKKYNVNVDGRHEQIEIVSDKYRTRFFIPVEQLDEMFDKKIGFEKSMEKLLSTVEDGIAPAKPDFSRIYPVFKPTASLKGMNVLSTSYGSETGMSVLYGEDKGETYRYLSNQCPRSIESVQKIAHENINSFLPILKQADIKVPLFSIDVIDAQYVDLISSLILNTAVQRQIRSMVGQKYIFAIPYSNLLLVARVDDRVDMYTAMMTAITSEFIQSPNKITDEIYYSNGETTKIFKRMNLF